MSTQTPSNPVRPIAVTVAGWILVLSAVLNITVGILYLYASGTLTPEPVTFGVFSDEELNKELDEAFKNEQADLIEGGADLILGIVELVIAIGFWRIKQWAWVAAVSWQALKLLFEIASVLLGGGTLVTILFASLMVFLLNQAVVRRAFHIQPENESTSQPVRILDSN